MPYDTNIDTFLELNERCNLYREIQPSPFVRREEPPSEEYLVGIATAVLQSTSALLMLMLEIMRVRQELQFARVVDEIDRPPRLAEFFPLYQVAVNDIHLIFENLLEELSPNQDYQTLYEFVEEIVVSRIDQELVAVRSCIMQSNTDSLESVDEDMDAGKQATDSLKKQLEKLFGRIPGGKSLLHTINEILAIGRGMI